MNAAAVQSLLCTRAMGRALHVHDTLPSTNAAAREAAREGAPHGAVFIAGEQTAGRGRFGRAWASPRGGLWMSLLLRPGADPAPVPCLPMAAALALAASLADTHGIRAQLAWPNDLVFQGKKLAGLLAESSFRGADLEFAILGIGVNVNNSPDLLPPEARDTAVSCMQAAGAPLQIESVAAAFLNSFEPLYEQAVQGQAHRIFTEWKAALDLIGQRITVRYDDVIFEGVVQDIERGGGLVLLLDNNEKAAIPMDRGSMHTNKYSKKL